LTLDTSGDVAAASLENRPAKSAKAGDIKRRRRHGISGIMNSGIRQQKPASGGKSASGWRE